MKDKRYYDFVDLQAKLWADEDVLAYNPLSSFGKNAFVDPLGIQDIRLKLYDNIVPFGYHQPFTRIKNALLNVPEVLREEVNDDIKHGDPNASALDAIWATYLNIPENNRRDINSNLGLTKQPEGYYSFTSPNITLALDIDEALGRYPNTTGPGLFEGENRLYMNGVLGNYTMGKGYDDRGSYLYYSDSKLNPDGTPNLKTGWDINPWSNTTKNDNETDIEDRNPEKIGTYGLDLKSIPYKIGNVLFGNIEDISMGIGTPVPIYGKMYLDDIYGVNTQGAHWFPEVVITPNNHAEGGGLNVEGNPFGTGTKAQYDHVTGIYQALVDAGIQPQAALDITNLKVAERGWSGYSTGDKKIYPNAKKFAEHILDWHGRMYPDSLHSKDFNSYWKGIMDGKHLYNPYYNKYKNDLLKTRPGVKKRINTYRAKLGLGPLVLNTDLNNDLLNANYAANGGTLFEDDSWLNGLKEWWDETVGNDITSKGRNNVKIEKDLYGNYTFNGRKPANGYTYYDRRDGNTYKFVNGKRTLVRGNTELLLKKQQEASKRVEALKKLDEQIGSINGYGTTDNKTPGGWDTSRLYRTINPAIGISISEIPSAGLSYLWDSSIGQRELGSIADEAYWARHLGKNRNFFEMPVSGIRFKGDYNSDGSLRLPDAEYTGVPYYVKRSIIKGILDKHIPVDPTGEWTVREEDRFRPKGDEDLNLTLFGNFSIRENNGSGIYDIYDSYDFPSNKFWFPNINRESGKLIEMRDTIWGPNAIPELYNPDYTKKK